MSSECSHTGDIRYTEPAVRVCAQCVEMGDRWVHLRMCLICGLVACCDNSKNKHATAHFHASGHPLVRSIEPRDSWAWCYVDNVFLDDIL